MSRTFIPHSSFKQSFQTESKDEPPYGLTLYHNLRSANST